MVAQSKCTAAHISKYTAYALCLTRPLHSLLLPHTYDAAAAAANSAEAEYYAQNVRRIAEVTGAQFGKPQQYEFEGVPFQMGPRVVFSPSFAATTADLR
jgi:hypothetical protein